MKVATQALVSQSPYPCTSVELRDHLLIQWSGVSRMLSAFHTVKNKFQFMFVNFITSHIVPLWSVST